MTVIRKLGAYWATILCLLLLAIWIFQPVGASPPANPGTDFDTQRALVRLTDILGDERPHPVDSVANDSVRERLLGQIHALGYTPEVRDQFHCNDVRAGAAICGRVRNVFFWIGSPGADAVMLAAHYDSVAAGPGAADDGIGVATILEIAHLLKDEPLKRPVLVLITDGEEAGLLGAAAFAAHDPLAKQIGAVVNLEARGTTGRANMFQTSTPNGNDIAALKAGETMPSANSLAADLYSILPNDTDLTMLLPLNIDAANYAIIGGASRYHTPLDNLDHLDPRSLGHMGASALSAVRGFTSVEAVTPEPEKLFSGLVDPVLLVIGKGAAPIVAGLGLLAALLTFIRTGDGGTIRTAIAPPLAVIAGVALATGIGMLVAAIRPEANFATAWPIAIRASFAAAALLGAMGTVQLLRLRNGLRLSMAAWFWFAAIVLLAFGVLPGFSTFAIWPLMAVIAATAAMLVPRLRPAAPWMMALAAILYALIALQVGAGAEDGLFPENAAPITVLLVFLFLFALPVAQHPRWLAPGLCALVLIVATTAALLVPAYSVDTPRHLNIDHDDVDGTGRLRIYDNGPLPAAMRAAADFNDTPDRDGYWHAPAPSLPDEGSLTIVSDVTTGTTRTVRLSALAPGADRQQILFEDGDAISAVEVNGAKPSVIAPVRYVGCTGRTCRALDITLTLETGAKLPTVEWARYRNGNSAFSAKLAEARPSTAQPVHAGDQHALIRRFPFWSARPGE